MTSNEIHPIDQEKSDQAHRRLCRKVAALFLAAMAEEDMGPREIATAINEKERVVRDYLRRVMDGQASDLQMMAYIATALNREFEFRLRPREDTHAGSDTEKGDPST